MPKKGRYKMLNEVKVIVCGKEYKLRTAESPNYVFALARALEAKINGYIAAAEEADKKYRPLCIKLGFLFGLIILIILL